MSPAFWPQAKVEGYAQLRIVAQGSVGKTFTWTAVMQLVEQGKLNLDTDINTYLDFRVPDTYAQPITLKHLILSRLCIQSIATSG